MNCNINSYSPSKFFLKSIGVAKKESCNSEEIMGGISLYLADSMLIKKEIGIVTQKIMTNDKVNNNKFFIDGIPKTKKIIKKIKRL